MSLVAPVVRARIDAALMEGNVIPPVLVSDTAPSALVAPQAPLKAMLLPLAVTLATVSTVPLMLRAPVPASKL